jgi:hypothetical protein
MKTVKIFSLVFSILLLIISCDKNDDSDDASQETLIKVNNSIVNGTWRVSYFNEDGIEQTYHFNNYNFIFSANKSISATNGSSTYMGTWATGTDDSTPKLILSFSASTGPFEEISEDWQIVTVTANQIDLKHISGGDGGIDLLTFSKNQVF